MFVHYANFLTADINQYKPQWLFNMDKVCVCVCVCLMVLLFCSSWSLWQKLHLPLQHLWVLYNDIVSSNMLKYIFWYYKRADNDLIERITLPWEHTEKIASWLSQTTVCRVHCWRNGTMVCHNHANRRFESYLKYISCWASCITVLLRLMHSIATIWKRNIRHSLYMFCYFGIRCNFSYYALLTDALYTFFLMPNCNWVSITGK